MLEMWKAAKGLKIKQEIGGKKKKIETNMYI